MKEVFYSDNNKDKPEYADFPPKEKFQAITGIIMSRLMQYPKVRCSYSGGSDSDIMIDLIENARKINPSLPKVDYSFFNTGLEMKATKSHVTDTAQKYGVEIKELRANPNIIQAVRKYGVPLMSKMTSRRFNDWQRHPEVPLSICDEYEMAEDKQAKYFELCEKYPKAIALVQYFCGVNRHGMPGLNNQFNIKAIKNFVDFLKISPPDFPISDMCCNICKKNVAHKADKGYDLIITGERGSEGGARTTTKVNGTKCFYTDSKGQHRLRPIYYVTDSDKEWYKETHGIKYSDAYEVYGLTRTGCCGCPISYKAVDDLEKIRPYEPNVVKAAWNIFGESYEYRRKYNEYKEKRKAEEKEQKKKPM